MVLLGDVDLLLQELAEPGARSRLTKWGYDLAGLPRLTAARERLAAAADKRWIGGYERVRARYGRAIAAVRERVCLGCFVTLPTSAAPRPASSATLGLCQSCGRLLYWG
jgi:predicted  nucleic acid-binding Zn-ribbon protein